MGQGECIAGLLPVWILRYADSTLLERIQDICHFMIAFHTPISLSTPHIYISTRPFLPSQSPLSRIFSRELSRAIKIRSGNLLTWPAPPLEWTGHESGVISLRYSPNGYRVVTGSSDKTIRIWDAESGAVVGEPLTGHNGAVLSVAYSPDGQRIISGSDDRTIRIWDAETGAAVGEPLEGHAYTIQSTAYSPDGQNIASGSHDRTVHVRDAFHHLSIQPSSGNLMRAGFKTYEIERRVLTIRIERRNDEIRHYFGCRIDGQSKGSVAPFRGTTSLRSDSSSYRRALYDTLTGSYS